jgi:hypothetical protein
MAQAEVYEYKWTSDHDGIIDGHTTPDGSAAAVVAGKKFSTIAPINLDHVPAAQPVNAAAKSAAAKDEAAKQAEADKQAAAEKAEDKADEAPTKGTPEGTKEQA